MKELKRTPVPEQPTHDQIAARAYQIWQERGGGPGHEADDWLQAEYELMHLPIRKLIQLEPPPTASHAKRKSLVAVVRAALF